MAKSGKKTTIKDLFEKVGLKGLKINAGFAEIQFDLDNTNRDAAFDMYVELITRISTQRLEDGQEKGALDSLFNLFKETRAIIKHHGRDAIHFTKIAVIILNQVVRPFTAKWHARIDELGNSAVQSEEFRTDLKEVQDNMRKYTSLLADMAGVEDITDLENVEV